MHLTCEECGHDGFTIGRSIWESEALTEDEATGLTTETTARRSTSRAAARATSDRVRPCL
jgi:hypothetical protein